MCGGNFRVGVRGASIGLGAGDEFEDEAVGIVECYNFVTETRRDLAG